MTTVGRPPASAPGGAQAIRRAVEILRTVAQLQRRGATLSHVARATGLNVTTTFRILRSLVDERLLAYRARDKSYHVGPLAFELGLAAPEQMHIEAEWRETIEEIARETGLTTYLVAKSGNEAVCLLCVPGPIPLRAAPIATGQRAPLGLGSPSLALLAALDDAEVAAIIEQTRQRLGHYADGAARADIVIERVKLVRERGFAVNDGHFVPGVTGIGVAVPPSHGAMQLAVSTAIASGGIGLEDAARIAASIKAAITRQASTRHDETGSDHDPFASEMD